MQCKLFLFKVPFSPSDNAVFDSFAPAKFGNPLASFDVNYFDPRKTTLRIPNAIEPRKENTLRECNYVQITQPASEGERDTRNYYFFVNKISFLSLGAVELSLSLDVLNTFFNKAVFTSNCHIVRRHKNTWQKSEAGSFYRTFDNIPEGFNIAQIQTKSETIQGQGNFSWIMSLVTTTNERENSGQVGYVRYYPIPTSDAGAVVAPAEDIHTYPTTKYSKYNATLSHYVFSKDLNGNPFEGEYSNPKSITAITKAYGIPYAPPILGEYSFDNGVLTSLDVGNASWQFSSSNVTFPSYFLTTTIATYIEHRSWKKYNDKYTYRTIYAGDPFNISSKYNYPVTDKLAVQRYPFSPRSTPDPKLATSEFTTLKLEYGGSSFAVFLQNFGASPYGDILVDYSVSPNSGNPVMFNIRPRDINGKETYRFNDDSRGFLIPTTDLTFPRWSSEYNQYRDFSNKYDRISAGASYASAGVSALTGLVGTAIAGATAGPIGVAVGLVGTATSTITGIINTWNSYESKRASEAQKPRNSAQSSIDLLTLQTGNKARWLLYEVPETLQESLSTFFHDFGYADDTYGNPTRYTATRYSFNFIQCDKVTYTGTTIPEWAEDELTLLLNQGVRIYHDIGSDASLVQEYGYRYDLKRQNLNVELTYINQRKEA